jgi:hypothetical protein
MEKEEKNYCRVITTFSGDNAYDYRIGDAIPTNIHFGRVHNGEWEQHIIRGNFNNLQLHDIVFLIQRGYSLEDIQKQVNADYSKYKIQVVKI